MDLRIAFQKAKEAGLLPGTLARRIGRCPDTLYKWADGTRNLSSQVQQEVLDELRKIKAQWAEIDLD